MCQTKDKRKSATAPWRLQSTMSAAAYAARVGSAGCEAVPDEGATASTVRWCWIFERRSEPPRAAAHGF